jgi:hypothetical protein
VSVRERIEYVDPARSRLLGFTGIVKKGTGDNRRPPLGTDLSEPDRMALLK